ncbi:ly6/PLAUR domain-containing protein 2-like [Hyla sarda]|uniref:ly6/PLAUR domain-containing protein 2-like n=1 Tax=Hyla sarda TaxID=327740 RepID=UPI0024C2AA53|nr:ly6/PLAUR domain-containing protein 2-like [Hyla sarda]
MMKRFLILLLATAALWDLAVSLQCYTCIKKPMRSCNETKECLPSQKSCRTVAESGEVGFPFNGESVVTKDCANNCQPTDPNALGKEMEVNCCESDLCNSGGLLAGASSNTDKPTSTKATTQATTKNATKSATQTPSNTQGVTSTASVATTYTALAMGAVAIRCVLQI